MGAVARGVRGVARWHGGPPATTTLRRVCRSTAAATAAATATNFPVHLGEERVAIITRRGLARELVRGTMCTVGGMQLLAATAAAAEESEESALTVLVAGASGR